MPNSLKPCRADMAPRASEMNDANRGDYAPELDKKQEDSLEDAHGHRPRPVRNLTEAVGNVYNKGTGFSTWFPG